MMKQQILWLGLVLACASPAHAHTSGTSFLELRAESATTLRATLDFDLRDLHALLQLDTDFDGALTWREIDSASANIEGLALANTRFDFKDGACSATSRAPLALTDHGEGPFARLSLTLSCPAGVAQLSIDYSAWMRFDPGHRALLQFTALDGKQSQAILARSAPTWRAQESRLANLQRFVAEGAYHLVTGYDHLAFLGVLLLALMRRQVGETLALGDMLRRAIAVITAFTLAHSLTLALSASGYVRLPSQPVEIIIADSVLIAALLNLHRTAPRHGARLAFGFGLVHGLGFSSALAELTSEPLDLWALAAFNLGIEAAQIAIAAVALPLMWWALRHPRNQRITLPTASLAIAGVAAVWVAERIV